jgi:hypothetical protein
MLDSPCWQPTKLRWPYSSHNSSKVVVSLFAPTQRSPAAAVSLSHCLPLLPPSQPIASAGVAEAGASILELA